MRDIKFRGKRVGNGRWVHGLPVNYCNKTYISVLTDFEEERVYAQYPHKEMWPYEVIPETVGQYTGLKDREGVEIWEGDVVRIEHDITETQSLGSIENKDLSVWEEVVETFEVEDVVVFVNGSFDVQEWTVGIFMPYEIEVIGNIHDWSEE